MILDYLNTKTVFLFDPPLVSSDIVLLDLLFYGVDEDSHLVDRCEEIRGDINSGDCLLYIRVRGNFLSTYTSNICSNEEFYEGRYLLKNYLENEDYKVINVREFFNIDTNSFFDSLD